MRIAITTPTGHIGSKLVDRLLSDGTHELVLLVRDPNKVKHFTDRGATAKAVNLENTEAVIEATRNIETLFWVNPPSYQVDDFTAYYTKLAENAATAIKTNGIKRVMFVSSMGAHLGEGVGVVNAFKPVERILREASPNLIILRPTFFMENYLEQMPYIAQADSIFMPVRKDATMSMIATQDIAATAAELLKQPFEGQKVVPLHGPREYTFDEAAEIIGRGLGKAVNHVTVEPGQTVDALTGMGCTPHTAEMLVELYTSIDTGRMKSESPRSAETTTPTTFDTFVKSVMVPAVGAK